MPHFLVNPALSQHYALTPRSLFRLPTENIEQVVREMSGNDPLHNLNTAFQLCHAIAEMARPLMYEKLDLMAEIGSKPMEKHLAFFEEFPELAKLVKELSLRGRTTDAARGAELCWVSDADEISRICRAFPGLQSLSMIKCFWDTRYGRGPQPRFENLTKLSLLQSTLLQADSFPATLMRHLDDVTDLSLSFAPCSLVDSDVEVNVANSSLPVESLIFLPTIPFQANFIAASVEAAREMLRRLTIMLTPAVYPPIFADSPQPLVIPPAALLDIFHFILPAFAFAPHPSINITWMYAKLVVRTVSPTIPRLALSFESGGISAADMLLRMAGFPVHELIDLVDHFGAATRITVALRAPAGAPLPTWDELWAVNWDWKVLGRAAQVTLEEEWDVDETSPFITPYALEDEDGNTAPTAFAILDE